MDVINGGVMNELGNSEEKLIKMMGEKLKEILSEWGIIDELEVKRYEKEIIEKIMGRKELERVEVGGVMGEERKVIIRERKKISGMEEWMQRLTDCNI